MQDQKQQLIADLEKHKNQGLPRSTKSSENLLREKMTNDPSTSSIKFTNKTGYASASTGDESPEESNSWDGDLGYPVLDDDDTEYRVTWYRWVMVLLYSLFNINCAI